MTVILEVRNPFTGELDHSVATTSNRELDSIVSRLRGAQPRWRAAGVDHRVDCLRRFASELHARRGDIISALATDTGREPLTIYEVDGLFKKIERDCALAQEYFSNVANSRIEEYPLSVEQIATPYALVGNIAPWNFPISLSFLDVLPALLMGCAVIVKPSEITPRFVGPIDEAIQTTPFLNEIFAFVIGDGILGAQLAQEVDYICLTGGASTGRKVYASAGARGIPASMELGGKDPVIVLDDADVETAAGSILYGGSIASGQICTSFERVYVARPLYQDFLDCITDLARRARANFEDPKGISVPFIRKEQADVFSRHLADAVSKGARIHTGGEVLERGGLWALPTVLSEVDHGMDVMRDESFAPFIPVMAVETESEAIDLANDSPYGLSAAVYGTDLKRASEVARRLRCGALSLNMWRGHVYMRQYEQEAFGCSGMGTNRIGPSGFHRFCRRTALISGDYAELARLEHEQVAGAFPV